MTQHDDSHTPLETLQRTMQAARRQLRAIETLPPAPRPAPTRQRRSRALLAVLATSAAALALGALTTLGASAWSQSADPEPPLAEASLPHASVSLSLEVVGSATAEAALVRTAPEQAQASPTRETKTTKTKTTRSGRRQTRTAQPTTPPPLEGRTRLTGLVDGTTSTRRQATSNPPSPPATSTQRTSTPRAPR